MHHRRKDIRTAGMGHGSASPYNYYGRTHDKERSAMLRVGTGHGHQLRRGTPVKHKPVDSWIDRGGGHGASRRD